MKGESILWPQVLPSANEAVAPVSKHLLALFKDNHRSFPPKGLLQDLPVRLGLFL